MHLLAELPATHYFSDELHFYALPRVNLGRSGFDLLRMHANKFVPDFDALKDTIDKNGLTVVNLSQPPHSLSCCSLLALSTSRSIQ